MSELKSGTLGDLKRGDICVVITRGGEFYEGLYVGRLGGFTLWRQTLFRSFSTVPRAIRETDIELIAAVCPMTPVFTESAYHEALQKLLSL